MCPNGILFRQKSDPTGPPLERELSILAPRRDPGYPWYISFQQELCDPFMGRMPIHPLLHGTCFPPRSKLPLVHFFSAGILCSLRGTYCPVIIGAATSVLCVASTLRQYLVLPCVTKVRKQAKCNSDRCFLQRFFCIVAVLESW